MRTYPLVLRQRVAADCNSSKLTQTEIAVKHGVSVSFITKLMRLYKETRELTPRPRPGCGKRILPKWAVEKIAEKIAKNPDITLAKLCDWWEDRISISTMSRALIKIGITRRSRFYARREKVAQLKKIQLAEEREQRRNLLIKARDAWYDSKTLVINFGIPDSTNAERGRRS